MIRTRDVADRLGPAGDHILLDGSTKAGNGGTAEAQANGGTIEIGDLNSGDNTGTVIEVWL